MRNCARRLVPLSNAVVAGVFLSVAVCHLLPHAVETGEEMAEDLNGFPAVFVVVLLGYLLIYFFEQVRAERDTHAYPTPSVASSLL